VEAGELMIVEFLPIQEGHEGEGRELVARSVELLCQMPGVQRGWAIQDQGRPGELVAVVLVNAACWPDIQRELHEAEWHKQLATRLKEILVLDRCRRLVGPAAG
jgi:hypothetical protein